MSLNIVPAGTAYIPWYNPEVQGASYYPSLLNALADSDFGTSDLPTQVHQLMFGNKANPDWQQLARTTPSQVLTDIEGDVLISSAAAVFNVQVAITDGAQYVDKWYGAADFGVYGVMRPDYGGSLGPAVFINSLEFAYKFPNAYQNGVRFSMKPNIKYDVALFAPIPFPQVYVDIGAGPQPIGTSDYLSYG